MRIESREYHNQHARLIMLIDRLYSGLRDILTNEDAHV